MVWWPFLRILVHLESPNAQPPEPSITCSDSYSLSSVHLIKKLIILVIQIQNTLLCYALVTIAVHFCAFLCILLHFGPPHAQPHDSSMTRSEHNPLSSQSNPEIDQIGHSGQIWKTFAFSCNFCPLLSILVHFGRLNDPSVWNSHQVFKDMYPTHQKLLNPTSPTFLAQFIKKILIKHMLFPWVNVDKSYHHLSCRLEEGWWWYGVDHG